MNASDKCSISAGSATHSQTLATNGEQKQYFPAKLSFSDEFKNVQSKFPHSESYDEYSFGEWRANNTRQ